MYLREWSGEERGVIYGASAQIQFNTEMQMINKNETGSS